MKLAVLGAGAIGVKHLEAASEIDGLEPVAIVEINETLAVETAKKYGVRAYTDYQEMLQKEKPDIAVIALPHFLHKEVSIRCAEHGSHILLEKPMALNTVECDEIIAAAERNEVKLMVGHTQHYFPENIEVRRIIESGELGKLVMINDTRNVNYYRADRPGWFFEKSKAGGGIMTNLGAHSIDKIQWMTQSMVTKVKASVSFHEERGDVEGSGIIFMETSSGVPAVITQSGYLGVSRNETEFMFTKGMLKLETGKGLSISRNGLYEPVMLKQAKQPLVQQLLDFMDAITNDKWLDCSGAYSKTVVSVIESIYASSETGTEQIVK
ncbi:Gfo/Idh/MocA family oxidoreductase [Paenibacillus sp. CGMCC 1.16610]|uniref:Gfo/Idh/MocA family oxidoreductase n=1 Tax=Paenibacillus anseongense TaxID=2682845 RepID=A0ABW9UJL0_9BACL|nr:MULTISPECIES: Gfo/Idh/MocA family oxidoreductase [Paenibacillus]MBA2941233.1 Gfo/Idh/MocA family oxidoreductase [Paenibacillus sp. CGMCC 1.16610]MVQ40053.1 gfo/Idh/MocA family oxidoreductase [Paenibacillus anseongense]